MKLYTEFHGELEQSVIGTRLREIAKKNENFKILTGYGSTSGVSKSKASALNSLRNMKKQGLIKAYLPAEKYTELLKAGDPFLETKQKYNDILKNDNDARIGNDGIIFIFVK